ncbi:ATP-binding protein [Desulfonema ishimotonii]|uniref:ATP-binding protein n=2 Tax=Desulfonema ishimotonii TaxID=45657 RepID=A0A401FT95_9BACT|nr:ATP-binding protein [Desulfonema ishimotonii]
MPENDKIKSLHLENFTVFEKADFEFCPGINVLIGANGTGKTHVMKISYGLLELCYYIQKKSVEPINFIGDIFQQTSLESLNRISGQAALAKLKYAATKTELEIFPKNKKPDTISGISGTDPAPKSCFIPAQEFLSINKGFRSTYENREIPYDRTYYDLSLALDTLPLRREKLTGVKDILDLLGNILAGKDAESGDVVSQEGGQFYLNLPEGRLDAPLVADGYRKLATLYYLLRNGSLTKNSVLFWDEPEANLNPKLIVETVRVLKMMAALGMQIFVATHDYLLSHELSLMAEYPSDADIDIRFFALHKPDRTAGVQVESGRTLAEIENNPILEEFAAHYDRESALFHQSEGQDE